MGFTFQAASKSALPDLDVGCSMQAEGSVTITTLKETSSLAFCDNHGSGKFLHTSDLAFYDNRGWPRSLIPLPMAARYTVDEATRPLWCNVASSTRHKNPQVSLLTSLTISSSTLPLIHSSTHPLIHSSTHRIGARETHTSQLHMETFSTKEPFVGSLFLPRRLEHLRPRTLLMFPVLIKQFINI